jgi:hypothetical protein
MYQKSVRPPALSHVYLLTPKPVSNEQRRNRLSTQQSSWLLRPNSRRLRLNTGPLLSPPNASNLSLYHDLKRRATKYCVSIASMRISLQQLYFICAILAILAPTARNIRDISEWLSDPKVLIHQALCLPIIVREYHLETAPLGEQRIFDHIGAPQLPLHCAYCFFRSPLPHV